MTLSLKSNWALYLSQKSTPRIFGTALLPDAACHLPGERGGARLAEQRRGDAVGQLIEVRERHERRRRQHHEHDRRRHAQRARARRALPVKSTAPLWGGLGTLVALCACGGGAGVLLGCALFNHKTAAGKAGFRWRCTAGAALYAALAVAWAQLAARGGYKYHDGFPQPT